MSLDTAFDDADLNGFVDGRIEPARAAALADGLTSDRETRDRIDGWKRQNEALRTMFASVLFEPVPVRLLPTSVPVAPPVASDRRRGRAWIPTHLAGVLGTTAVGMALVGFAVGAVTSVATEGFGLTPPAAHREELPVAAGVEFIHRAAETHRTYLEDAIRPVEITVTEQPKLLRWIQRRMSTGFRIPDLQHQGWGLIGGRVVPGRLGPAAFLVYGAGSDRLGLYVSRGADLDEGGVGTVTDDAGPPSTPPIEVTGWSTDGFAYALTSDHGGGWLDRNGGTLRSGVMSQIHGNGATP